MRRVSATRYQAGLLGLMCMMAHALAAEACNVPVFRYALERWPPDAHVVRVAARVATEVGEPVAGHHANVWIERAPPEQKAEVAVLYADEPRIWYEGPWEEGLLTRLCDSPLRRKIAHELLTGTTAVFVLVESTDAGTNAALWTQLEKRLATLEAEVELPDELDYEDERDGWGGPGQGQPLGTIPAAIAFTLHRVARDDAAEAFFVGQLVGLEAAAADPSQPVVAVVYGQGRVLPLAGQWVSLDVVSDVCEFLCGKCSCRVKALNPGIDLLMTANWDEAVYAYPRAVTTVLPDGRTFALGGTGVVETAGAEMAGADGPPSCAAECSGNAVRLLVPAVGLTAGVAVLLYLLKVKGKTR